MPSEYINNPKHWSDRAAEMRAVANTMNETEARAAMLRLAADYDKLAERATARANGQPPGQPPGGERERAEFAALASIPSRGNAR